MCLHNLHNALLYLLLLTLLLLLLLLSHDNRVLSLVSFKHNQLISPYFLKKIVLIHVFFLVIGQGLPCDPRAGYLRGGGFGPG